MARVSQARHSLPFDRNKLLLIEPAKATDELDGEHRHETLCIEAARPQESDGQWHLETRAAHTGGVGNQGDGRPVGLFNRHAENERRAYLRSEAQVHEPDLAAFGRVHRCFSA